MSFGNNLLSLRNEKGLSQKELASQLGVTTGTIAEWESDESSPNLVEFSRLSKILGVPMDNLLTEENTTPSEEPIEVVPATSSPVECPTEQPAPMPLVTKRRKKAGWFIGVATGVVALIVAAILIFTSTPFAENAAAIEVADASVVTIFCYDYDGNLAATGSGFVAFDSKTIITNYHVMTSAYTCKVSTNQDITYEATKILCYSKELDIAIIRVDEDTGLKPLQLGNSKDIKKGETVVAIGSPLGIKNTVSTGVLSGRVMQDNMDVLQFTAPISSGSSGGALFNNKGTVIGITYASYVNGQNLNLAIPIELAVQLHNGANDAVGDISYICKKEHPYIQYLELHPQVPTVTLADLNAHPEKYDGKAIKLIAYISSVSWDTENENMNSIYLSATGNISHNSSFDDQVYRNSNGASSLYYVSLYNTHNQLKDISGTITSGSIAIIVGQFNYRPNRSFESWRDYFDLYVNPDILPYYVEIIS